MYITKRVRVVSLARDIQSYGAHKDASTYVTQQQKTWLKKEHNSAKILWIVTNIEHDLYFSRVTFCKLLIK